MKRAAAATVILGAVALFVVLIARRDLLRPDVPVDAAFHGLDSLHGSEIEMRDAEVIRSDSGKPRVRKEEGDAVSREGAPGPGDYFRIRVRSADQETLSSTITALELNEATKDLLASTHYNPRIHGAQGVLEASHTDDNLWHVTKPLTLVPVGLIVASSGHRLRRIVLQPEEWLRDEETIVQLEPSSPLTIRVLEEGGAPIEGARVHIRSDDLGLSDVAKVEELFESRWLWMEFESNASGEVNIVEQPTGLVSVYTEPSESYASSILWSQKAVGDLVLRCRASYSITGRVVLGAATEIGGIGLTVISTDGRWSEVPLQTTYTDESGAFKFESLPADGTIQYVVISDARFVPIRSESFVPVAARVVELTLVTEPATRSQIKVVTSDGVPMTNLGCSVYGGRVGRLPISLTTTGDGMLMLPGYMQEEEMYSLRIDLSGCEVASDMFSIQSGDSEPVVVTVPGVSRVLEVVVAGGRALNPDRLIEFYPSSNAEGYSSTFKTSTLPTFLPSGCGTLVVEVAEGLYQSERIHLPESEDVRIALADASARLEFDVPATDITGISILNMQRYPVARFHVVPDRVRCDLIPGDYLVEIERESGNEDVGPVSVPPSGLFLGILDLGASATASGRVVDENRTPIEGIPVVAYGPLNYRSEYSFTDRSGEYVITGLPAGSYAIECLTGRVLGGGAPSSRVTVFLGCNSSVSDINFTLALGETQVEFEINPSHGAVGSFILSGNRSVFVDGAPSRVLSVSSLESPSIAGFWERNSESLSLYLDQLPKGTRRHTVRRVELLKYSVPVGIGFRAVRVQGHVLGVDAPTNQEGQVIIRTNDPKDVEVLTQQADGESRWQPISAASDSGFSAELIVTAMDNSPIQGALVAGRSSMARSYTDSQGAVRVGLREDEWLWIDHSEYWAVQQRVNTLTLHVQLRRSSSAALIPFEFMPNAASARIAPQFDLGYDFLGDGAYLRRQESGWSLPVVPSGEYSAWLQSESGVEVHYTLNLLDSGGYRVQPD